MRFTTLSSALCFLMLIHMVSHAQQKYPGIPKSTDPNEVSIRLPNDVMPVMGCWFWHKEQLEPFGYQ